MDMCEILKSKFTKCIDQAIGFIQSHELAQAYKLIVEAIKIDPNAPQPHNLLGIWFELKGDADKARKHYRAAYALDPTFKPPCKNLERICTMFRCEAIPYDFGNEPDGENTDNEKKNIIEKREQRNERSDK